MFQFYQNTLIEDTRVQTKIIKINNILIYTIRGNLKFINPDIQTYCMHFSTTLYY